MSSDADMKPKVAEPTLPTKPEEAAAAENTKREEAASKSDKPPLANHDSSILDLAFAMDCTGSMGSYIKKAQSSIRSIVEEIVANEKSDIRLALVEYRDHPPQDSSFITRVLDFTPSVSKMKKRLDACSASGGGDTPEAVADALHQVSKLSWREEATKICVFIADAPPHGMGANGDGFPNGCPLKLDPIEITGALAQKGVTMYMVGCEPAVVRYRDFFMTVAHMTGGQYVPLTNAELLAKVIIGGAQEEITLERLMRDAQEEMEQEVQAMGGWDRYEECADHISANVMSKLNARGGFTAKQLQMNSSALPEASSKAKKWSNFKNMSELRSDFVEDGGAAPAFGGGMGSSKKKSKGLFGFSSSSLFGSSAGPPVPMRGMPVACAPQAGPSLESAMSAPAEDMSYNVTEREEIDQNQAKRMLQKMYQQR